MYTKLMLHMDSLNRKLLENFTEKPVRLLVLSPSKYITCLSIQLFPFPREYNIYLPVSFPCPCSFRHSFGIIMASVNML